MKFNSLENSFDAEINVGGNSYSYFGGTAYLGIPKNDEFIAFFLVGLYKYGLNNGTSRGNNVQLGIYNEAEDYAANKYGAEAGLVTSSGYLAAQLAVKTLKKLGKLVFAPVTHSSLWLTEEEPRTKSTFAVWAGELVQEINSSENSDWVIVSNSMNNLYPEIFDFSFLEKVKSNKNVVLILDDSHGIGINHGGMTALSIAPKKKNIQTVLVASMAKALGVDAGLVLGPKKLIDLLKNSNEFLGASPPSGAGLYAFIQAENIYHEGLQKLRTNINFVSTALQKEEDWHFIPDFPVFFYKKTDLSSQLVKHNILASSFPYPTKDGPLVNRIVLSSWHKPKHLKHLISTLTLI